jgi:hypothetical protein
MSSKPHRIRVRTKDGKPREQKELNKLKSNQLGMPHLDIVGTEVPTEFIICAPRQEHIEQVRAKLDAIGLEEIAGGDTTIAETARPASRKSRSAQPGAGARRSGDRRRDGGGAAGSLTPETEEADLKKKPYGFVSLPEKFESAAPVWHDGTSSEGRLSGEVRFELETLTPLLVGWERG